MLQQIQTFSWLQELQWVVSQHVDDKARHPHWLVHAALQHRRQRVGLGWNRRVVVDRRNGAVDTPGDHRCRIGVDQAATQHNQILHAAAGGEPQDSGFIWEEGRKVLENLQAGNWLKLQYLHAVSLFVSKLHLSWYDRKHSVKNKPCYTREVITTTGPLPLMNVASWTLQTVFFPLQK